MKNYLLLLFTMLLFSAYAQVAPPQAFSYSAVARDGFGNPLVNQNVGIQFSILKGSTVGPIQYQENHFTTTNQFGLFNLLLGTGAVQQGIFANINWGSDTYYLKVGLDAIGGTNFAVMGTTQFLSVPYALYAGNANNNSDHDTSATNELQTLSITGNTLQISLGNSVAIPNDGDTSATNELQNLSLSGDTLKITGGNKLVLPYNAQMGFTVKINGVSITDPSINHVMVAPFVFLTSTNYRYDLQYNQSASLTNDNGFLKDTTTLVDIGNDGYYEILSTSTSCSGQRYVYAYGHNPSASPGRIFGVTGLGGVYYIPQNATPTNINFQSSYYGGGCSTLSGSAVCYPIFLNNPTVTGYPFGTKMKVAFSRN